jgi:hypothetical protein
VRGGDAAPAGAAEQWAELGLQGGGGGEGAAAEPGPEEPFRGVPAHEIFPTGTGPLQHALAESLLRGARSREGGMVNADADAIGATIDDWQAGGERCTPDSPILFERFVSSPDTLSSPLTFTVGNAHRTFEPRTQVVWSKFCRWRRF